MISYYAGKNIINIGNLKLLKFIKLHFLYQMFLDMDYKLEMYIGQNVRNV